MKSANKHPISLTKVNDQKQLIFMLKIWQLLFLNIEVLNQQEEKCVSQN